jgi:hypothetical protein
MTPPLALVEIVRPAPAIVAVPVAALLGSLGVAFLAVPLLEVLRRRFDRWDAAVDRLIDDEMVALLATIALLGLLWLLWYFARR